MRKFLDNFEEYAILMLFPMLVVVVLSATAARYFTLFPMFWGEELALYIMVYMGYIGIALAMKRRAHIGVSAFVGLFPSTIMRRFFHAAQLLIILTFCGIISYYVFVIIQHQSAIGQTSPALNLPIAVPYAAVPLGMLLLAVRTAQVYAADWHTLKGE